MTLAFFLCIDEGKRSSPFFSLASLIFKQKGGTEGDVKYEFRRII